MPVSSERHLGKISVLTPYLIMHTVLLLKENGLEVEQYQLQIIQNGVLVAGERKPVGVGSQASQA